MARLVSRAAVASFFVFVFAVVWLARLERGGPAHGDLVLDGGIPATLYVPYARARNFRTLDPPPRAHRPPAVILVHGFAGDRNGVSGLARGLARHGYAVLAIDVRGHGANRNAFDRSRPRGDALYADLAAAADALRASPYVDGSRIAVMGHSMGASAALDFATRDSAVDATVAISGGTRMLGPHRPANTLFIYASGDPERIRERSRELAARLAGVPRVEVGRVYGEHGEGRAVRAVEVAGTDHLFIVWSPAALADIVDWLDAVFELEGNGARARGDPRGWPALLIGLSLLALLPGLGLVVGRVVPEREQPAAEGGARGLAALVAGLAATMPLVAVGRPAALFPLEVADVIVMHLSLAGIALLVFLRLRGQFALRSLVGAGRATLVGALVGFLGIYVLLSPFAVLVHRLAPTPERLALGLCAFALLLPFALAFQLLVRRGPVPRATLWAVAGRVLVLFTLMAGVWLGVLGGVVVLMLPSLAAVFVLLELVAAAIYAVSRNLTAIALIEAAFVAWVFASTMPVRV